MIAEILTKRVDDLEWSVRAENCLRNANIVFVWQLVQLTEVALLSLPNLGRRTLNEIKFMLSRYGLYLGSKPAAPELVGDLINCQWVGANINDILFEPVPDYDFINAEYT